MSQPTTARAATLEAPSSREKILETAESAFAAAGYEGVGMRQIASDVGLGKSSLFHHFPTKLELYCEVLDRVLGRLETALEAEGPAGVDAAVELDHWITAVVDTLAEDVPSARLLLRSLVEEEPLPWRELDASERAQLPFEVRLERVLDRLRGLLERGIAEGDFRPLSVGDAMQTLIGALVFHFASGDLGEAVIGEPVFSRAAVERRRREVIDFIRRGLRA
jgi:AcrR family transcriptional regulator